jgi:hypothetical protein
MSAWTGDNRRRAISIPELIRAAKTAIIRSPFVSIIVVKAGKVHVFADFLVEDFAMLRVSYRWPGGTCSVYALVCFINHARLKTGVILS